MRGNPQGSIIIISLVMCDMGCSSPRSDPERYLLANGEKAGIGPKQPMGLQGGARLITPPASPEKEMGKPDAGAGSRDSIFTEIQPLGKLTVRWTDSCAISELMFVMDCVCANMSIWEVWIGLWISESIPKMEKQPRWQIVRCELMAAAASQSTITVKTATVNV